MPQDIFARLVSEHREIESLMDRLAATHDRQIFNDLAMKLSAHMQAEETTFYQAIRDARDIHPLVMESYETHHMAALLLRELQRSDATTEDWRIRFGVVRELVEHHIEDEENRVFPRAQTILGSRAESLGAEYDERHQRVLAHA